MNFIITILAHKPITTLTPLYLTACITRVAWSHPIPPNARRFLSFF